MQPALTVTSALGNDNITVFQSDILSRAIDPPVAVLDGEHDHPGHRPERRLLESPPHERRRCRNRHPRDDLVRFPDDLLEDRRDLDVAQEDIDDGVGGVADRLGKCGEIQEATEFMYVIDLSCRLKDPEAFGVRLGFSTPTLA